ncbi:MAG: carbohydrate ABC transporter permease [Maricaulaceae bacterium]
MVDLTLAPTDTLTRAVTRPVLGLVAGLLVMGLVLGGFAQARSDQARRDLTQLKAAADVASWLETGSIAVDTPGDEPERVRVVDAAQKRVMVDTAAETGETPRPLTRAEKPLFDAALQIQANKEANAEPGGRPRPEVLFAQDGDRVFARGGLQVGDAPALVEVARRIPPVQGLSAFWQTVIYFGFVACVLGPILPFLRRQMPDWGFWTASGVIGLVQVGGLALHLNKLLTDAGAGVLVRTGAVAYPNMAIEVLFSLIAGGVVGVFVAWGGVGKLRAAMAEHGAAYAYIAPAAIGMLVLAFFPFFFGVALSFTDTTLFNQNADFQDRFVGLSNYTAILSDFDLFRSGADGAVIDYENFYWTFFVTLLWTVVNVTIGVTVGLGLALLLNTPGLKFKGLYRTLLILPWAIPNYITALIWKGMFHPQFGVINQGLVLVGLEPVAWFDGVVSSFMTGIVVNGWLSFPFMMVVSLGALQSINQDLYEAARIEGASPVQQFFAITLPALRPALAPSIMLSVIWTFNMFNVIYLVSGGEPAGANEILIIQAYRLAFEEYRYGYSAAYAVVIFLLLLGLTFTQNRVNKASEAAA